VRTTPHRIRCIPIPGRRTQYPIRARVAMEDGLDSLCGMSRRRKEGVSA
jgi:hypothetical protein